MSIQHNAAFMSGNRDFDIQRNDKYRLVIPGLDSNITLFLKGVTAGAGSNEVIEIPYGNSSIKLAGVYSTEDGSIIVRDFISVKAIKEIEEWRKLVYDQKSGVVNTQEKYKKSCYLDMLSMDGTVTRRIVLKGVWPTADPSFAGSQDDHGPREVEFPIAIDQVIKEYLY